MEQSGHQKSGWAFKAGLLISISLALVLGLSFLPRPAGEWISRGPFALSPPIFAILLALVTRRILLSLFMGVWLGAALQGPHDPVQSLYHTAATYILPNLINLDTLYMISFTLSLMGMVGILIRGGGIEGLVGLVTRLARGRRSTQTLVGAMGLAVFFDDYANTVVVGTTSRRLTDKFRISREKLAYLVDSTAAPVASLALVSTWIGIEIRYLDEQLPLLSSIASSGYGVFLSLIPYRFYCILTLGMVFVVATTGRDLGPMLKAEKRALQEGKFTADGSRPATSASFQRFQPAAGTPLRWYNGAIPILTVLGAILVSFFLAGSARLDHPVSPFSLSDWQEAFCAVEGTGPLMAGSGAAGALMALLLVVAQRILSLRESLKAMLTGMSAMLPAIALISLAIALRNTTDGEHLGTAEYLISLLTDVNPLLVPVTIFATAALVAFSTGTSWGTMGILLPVAVPLAAATFHGMGNQEVLMLLTTGAVLDGAVYGDHCSPISDTTMLSSIGSGSDHMDHVRTQFPYATISMLLAGGFGYVLVPFTGAQPWVAYLAGLSGTLLLFFTLGRRVRPLP